MNEQDKTNFLREHGEKLYNLGYDILPIRDGLKTPIIKKWTTVELNEAVLAQWQSDSRNRGIGIRAKYFPAVDLDISDEATVMKLIEWCLKNLGAAPIRVGRKPRCLLVFRAEEPFKKMRSTKYEDFLGETHQVEILGDGQQFVAFATHPDTNKPYTWKGKSLLELKPDELPIVSKSQMEELIKFFESIALDEWREVQKLSKTKNTHPERDYSTPQGFLEYEKTPLGVSVDEAKQDLRQLGDEQYFSYDTWLHVGMALYHEFSGDEKGFMLWDGWSRASATYNFDEIARKWPSFKHELGDDPVTYRYIRMLVRKKGEPSEEAVEEIEEVSISSAEQENPYGLASVYDIRANLSPPDWLIENYMEKETMGVMYAPSSSYKSFISLDIALSIATGRDWQGNKTHQGNVLYVAGEGQGGLPKRIAAWSIYHDVELSPHTPLTVTQCAPDLHNVKRAIHFSNHIAPVVEQMGGVDLIVIDTMARAFGEGEENSNSDVMKFINNATNVLRNRFHCTVLIIHHTGKADRSSMRGASSLRDALDFAHRLERDKSLDKTVKIIDEKEKDHDDSKEMWLKGHVQTIAEFPDALLDSLVFERFEPTKEDKMDEKEARAHKIAEDAGESIQKPDLVTAITEEEIVATKKAAENLIESMVENKHLMAAGDTISVF
jgi:hypothetical protein